MKACRSVAQAVKDEGKGDAAGAEVVAHPQGRIMPKASASASSVGAPSDHLPIACSPAAIGRARRWLSKSCRSVAQALEDEGEGSSDGMKVMAHPQDRIMPTPQPQQAAWAPRVTIHPSFAFPRPKSGVFLKSCRSVAQALEDEDEGGATGTEVVTHPQDRIMPTLQPQQAPWAPRVSIHPLFALPRQSGGRGDGS